MKHSAEDDRFGLAAYKSDGYIDASDEAESVSRTLEYAYDDWCIAQVAGAGPQRGLPPVPARGAGWQARVRPVDGIHARARRRALARAVRSPAR